MLTVDIKFLNPSVCDLSFNKKIIKDNQYLYSGVKKEYDTERKLKMIPTLILVRNFYMIYLSGKKLTLLTLKRCFSIFIVDFNKIKSNVSLLSPLRGTLPRTLNSLTSSQGVS